MESFNNHVIPALIRLAKSDAMYESYNSDTREWSSKVGFRHPLGRVLGNTPHYTGYFNEDKNLYSIYEKGTNTNPVAQNITTAEAAVDRWIELERAAQEGVPMIGMEPEVELAPIRQTADRRFSTQAEAEDAWRAYQAERGKKPLPWRRIGDIDDPRTKYQMVGGTALEESMSVPFEEQRVIWRKLPEGTSYRIETKDEYLPHKQRIKKTRLSLDEIAAEARMSQKGMGEWTSQPMEFQYPMDVTSEEWGVSDYDYPTEFKPDYDRAREEVRAYQTRQAFQKAMAEEDTGMKFGDVEEYEPTDEDIRRAAAKMERWYATHSEGWSPESEAAYEAGKSEWLARNVPLEELEFIEQVVVDEPIEKKGAKSKTIKRRPRR